MPRLGRSWFVQALLGVCIAAGSYQAVSASGNTRRGLQLLSEGDTVVNGVLNLYTAEGVAACEASCNGAFAEAFGVSDASIGCVCPEEEDATGRRRRNLGESVAGRENNRSLRGLTALDTPAAAAFTARISGGLDGGAAALEFLSAFGPSALASSFGVEESELEVTTLTVTPPPSGDASETLTVITNFFDASDIPILAPSAAGGGSDWAGGGRGAALFLAMLVLLVLTCCCGGCVVLGLLWKNGGGPLAKAANFKRDSFRMHPQVTENPPRPNSEGNAAAASASAGGSSPSLVRRESASRSEDSGNTAAAKAADGGGGIGAGGSHGGDEAAGGGGSTGGGRAPASSTRPLSGAGQRDFVKRGRGAGNGVDGGAVAAAASEGSGDGGDKIHVPRNVSMEESGGTNPLYKNGAPPDTSGSGLDSQSTATPGRSRFSTFLGTPARLRRLAVRMGTKSPAPSSAAGSQRSGSSNRHSRTGSSSSKSRKHRRQETFPGAYSQRNSSELDHQRPPADPVYTFMIKTIAAKGFKFMTTTEIAFCAMRMYSHFRRTEGNYKRLTVMQNAENVPPVYEIIWRCDGTSDGNPKGVSRFFSSTDGTDAEQQKSLLACLLALSWDGSASSRRTLQRALTPTRSSQIPAPEDIFWDEFKDNTDALSGDDEMVVVARVVVLVADSSNKPGEEASSPVTTAAASAGNGRTEDENVTIEHGDIMQALSGAHLREVGIAIKEARPGWQEAHVQLVSVLLVIAYLEEGAKNASPGGKRPDPLSSLEWVALLTPEALDAFLVEKLGARRALVELDLEPSGLVIKHDDDGEVARVEPAVVAEKKPSSGGGSWIGSRGHQKILPKSSGRPERKSRKHRRTRSTESLASGDSKQPSPVVITTVLNRKASQDGGKGALTPAAAAAASGATSSGASVDSNSQSGRRGGGGAGSATSIERNSLQTIAQLRPLSSGKRPPAGATGAAAKSSGGASAASAGSGGGFGFGVLPPKLTLDADEFAVRVPAKGSSVRSELSRGLSPAESQGSSVATRVYAPSSVGGGDQGAFSRGGAAWALEGSDEDQRSPGDESAMSQVSIAASRFLSSPINALGAHLRAPSASSGITAAASTAAALPPANVNDTGSGSRGGSGGGADAMTAAGSGSAVVPVGAAAAHMGFSQDLSGMPLAEGRPRSPSAFSEAAGRSEAGFSDAASRYDSGMSSFNHRNESRGGAGAARNPSGLALEPATPMSAAGSRFDALSPGSEMTFTSRVGVGSPTAASAGPRRHGGAVGGGGALTGRSTASSMRSDGGGSFFSRAGGGSQRSGVGLSSAASGSSWDEEDLQNMGARWLADRAYNQKFDEHK